MIKIIVIVSIYIISFLIVRKYTQIAYSKGGKNENLELDAGDLLSAIVPGINTLSAIVMLVIPCYANGRTMLGFKLSYKKFFEINKKD